MSASLLAVECIAFKSQQSGKYVSYMRESEGLKKILQVREDNTMSPFARFHPEPSSQRGGYYHIKCLYNNKYWAVQQHVRGSYIHVDANVPQEDLSSSSCTLFRIEIDANNICKIYHGYARGGRVSIYTSHDSPSGRLLVGNKEPETFKLILMLSKTVLPKTVCFKGVNGKYLKVGTKKGDLNFMEFTVSDKNDWHAFHTIQTNEDGTICVYNNSVDKWWRASPGWIWANHNSYVDGDPSRNLNTTFLPFKLDDERVALKCLSNNKFCRILTDYWVDCLFAGPDSVTNDVPLQVEEPLLSRRIYDVEYHLEDARVYRKEIIYAGTVSDVNRTSMEREHEIPIEYSVTTEKRWESSTSWKRGASMTIGFEIPKVNAKLEVQLQAEEGGSNTWGEKHQEKISGTHTFKGKVGPHKKVTVEVVLSMAACDVPFSYWQEDVLADGKRVPPQKFDDGIFHGINIFDVTDEATEEPLKDA